MAHDDLIRLNRRGLLKSGAGIAAAVAGESLFVGKALAAGGAPEVKGARLGFIALTDAAPLMRPVVVLMLRPAGRFGQAHEVGTFVA